MGTRHADRAGDAGGIRDIVRISFLPSPFAILIAVAHAVVTHGASREIGYDK
jgi:hypothetical protein